MCPVRPEVEQASRVAGAFDAGRDAGRKCFATHRLLRPRRCAFAYPVRPRRRWRYARWNNATAGTVTRTSGMLCASCPHWPHGSCNPFVRSPRARPAYKHREALGASLDVRTSHDIVIIARCFAQQEHAAQLVWARCERRYLLQATNSFVIRHARCAAGSPPRGGKSFRSLGAPVQSF